MAKRDCKEFFGKVDESLKGMRVRRREALANHYCVVDFRNPKVTDYGYEEVGFRTISEPEKGGSIGVDLKTGKVEGQIPMPWGAIGRREDIHVIRRCDRRETMLHGVPGDDVSFAVFIGCRDTPEFWRDLKEMAQTILAAGSAKGLTPRQRDML